MPSESTQDQDPAEVILKELIGIAYHKAKMWRTWSILLKTGIFAYGVAAIFIPHLNVVYSLMTLGILALAFWIETKSANYKNIAESLKRKHELMEGFNKKPSIEEMTHLKMDIPEKLNKKLAEMSDRGIEFASKKPKGAKRVLENLCESAFFSHHEAKYCANWLLAIFTITTVTSLMLLFTCASWAGVAPIAANAAKCISSALIFLISLGVLKAYFAYRNFSRKARATDESATSMLAVDTAPEECDAQTLLSEYQIARSGAPLIPTWVWKRFNKELNANWTIRAKNLLKRN